jgi:flagellar protein FliS
MALNNPYDVYRKAALNKLPVVESESPVAPVKYEEPVVSPDTPSALGTIDDVALPLSPAPNATEGIPIGPEATEGEVRPVESAPPALKTQAPAAASGTYPGAGAADAYRNNAVLTATSEELTLMLYDGALRFMNQAIVHMVGKRVEPTHAALIRVQEIFAELRDTLNLDYEISQNLYNLYEYMISQLIRANVEKNPEHVRQVIGLTRELRETWAQAMQVARQGGQEQGASAR